MFFIPVFHVFQGFKWTDTAVVGPAIYCVALSAFCEWSYGRLKDAESLANTLCGNRGLEVVLQIVSEPGELALRTRKTGLGGTDRRHYWGYASRLPYRVDPSQQFPTFHDTGSSGVGELIANTLAVRNVTVAVLDVKPIQTENCASPLLY